MKLLMLLLGLLAGKDAGAYEAEVRRAYLAHALEAIQTADPQKLGDAVNYVNTMDRNKCRSAFRRLRVQCVIEAAARNCKSLSEADKRDQCTLYSDVIATVALAEQLLITEEQRYQIMQQHRDYRSALRAEIRRWYGTLAADFALSEHYSCDSADRACVAAAVDAYCLDRADRQNLAWQHCAAGLVWFIGTSRP